MKFARQRGDFISLWDLMSNLKDYIGIIESEEDLYLDNASLFLN